MRKIPIPPVVLCLLMPLLALAQPTRTGHTSNWDVAHSPLTWFWGFVVAVAAIAFLWSIITVSRNKGPRGPISGPRSP